MKNEATTPTWRTLAALTVAALGLTACAGLEGEPDRGVDLEIHWTLKGSITPSLCTVYGIDRWSVRLEGPQRSEDPRQLVVVTRCVAESWDTSVSLYGIAEGLYAVDVAALDVAGEYLGGARDDITLRNQGFVQVVNIPVYPTDWAP